METIIGISVAVIWLLFMLAVVDAIRPGTIFKKYVDKNQIQNDEWLEKTIKKERKHERKFKTNE